jgi:hypothetical protein
MPARLPALAALVLLACAPAASALEYESNFGSGGQLAWSTLNNNSFGIEADGDVLAPSLSTTNPNAHDRIQVFSATGAAKTTIGTDQTHTTAGTQNGELSAPADVAVAPNGDVYVMDAGNDKVQVFEQLTPDVYTWKTAIGSAGSGLGQFGLATGIAMAGDGSFYVADYNLNRVTKFNPAGVAVYAFNAPSSAVLNGPVDVEEQAGTLYVADYNNNRVMTLVDNGGSLAQPALLQYIGSSADLSRTVSVAASGSRLYVTDFAELEVYNATSGARVHAVSACCGGEAINPRGFGLGPGGLYVADYKPAVGASRVVRYVNRAPVADFTLAPAAPATGEAITLTSTSADGDAATGQSSLAGTIATVEWDLDDDGAYDDATGGQTSTSFATAGTFDIGLRVTDDDGAQATAVKPVTVGAAASATPTPAPTVPPEEVILQVAELGTHGEMPSIGEPVGLGPVIQRPGSRRAPVVRLRARPSSPRAGKPVRLDASASTDADGKVRGVRWDLNGDGSFDDATGRRIVTEFARPGRAKVEALVDDDGGRSTAGTLRLRVRRGEGLPNPRPLVEQAKPAPRALGFEHGFAGWQRRGEAFDGKPSRDQVRLDEVLNLKGGLGGSVGAVAVDAGGTGKRVATSFQPRRRLGAAPHTEGDLPIGMLVSPALKLTRRLDTLTFKLAGEEDGKDVRIEVWLKGDPARKIDTRRVDGAGTGFEEIAIDLHNHASGTVVLVAIDDSDIGHISIDNVKLAPGPTAPTDPFAIPERPRLYGFMDTHTHPTAHQGHGALEAGQRVYMGVPGGPLDLYQANPSAFYEDVGRDHNLHFGGILTGAVVNAMEHRAPGIGPFELANTAVHPPGKPGPAHEHMHITEIHRAYQGGLRLISSLSVSNAALEALTSPNPGPPESAPPRTPETRSILAHVQAMRELVQHNSGWMRIVYSPQEAWQAVADEKLAVVLGTEADGLGNLGFASAAEEVDWLFRLGIRQVGPVHAADNRIGGTALFQDVYNTFQDMFARPANRSWDAIVVGLALTLHGAKIDGNPDADYGDFHKVDPYGCQSQSQGECISWRYKPKQTVFSKIGVAGLGSLPVPVTDVNVAAYTDTSIPRPGMRNQAGLTAYGEAYIRALMSHGMLIDTDHMSDKTFEAITFPGAPGAQRGPVWDRRGTERGCSALTTVQQSIAEDPCFAQAYPLMSSHTLFRGQSIPDNTHVKAFMPREFERTPLQVEWIRHSGGTIAPMVTQDPVVDPRQVPSQSTYPDWRLIPNRDDASFFYDLMHAPNNCAGSVTGWVQAFLYGAAKMQADPPGPYLNRTNEEGGIGISTDMALIGGPGPRFNDPSEQSPTACPSAYQANGADNADTTQFGDPDRIAEEQLRPEQYNRPAQNPATKVQYVLPTEEPAGAQIRGLVRPGSPMNSDSIVDYNVVGLQTYGLLPDFIQDAKNIGLGNTGVEALFNSADRYVRMWDKALIISGCVGAQKARCTAAPDLPFNRADACRNTCPNDSGRGLGLRPDGSQLFP